MSYWFFLSYARDDNKRWGKTPEGFVKTFYDDLCLEIDSRKGKQNHPAGFFDNTGIKLGESWPEALASALQESRVFVGLFSASYFKSEFCGKEWAVFVSRIEAYAKQLGSGKKLPGLMLPVLWESEKYVREALPSSLSDAQYKNAKYGEKYAVLGLRSLMLDVELYKEDYHNFVRVFADEVIEVAERYRLPPLDSLQPLKDVMSAFLSDLREQEVVPATDDEQSRTGAGTSNNITHSGKTGDRKKRVYLAIAAFVFLSIVAISFGARKWLDEKVPKIDKPAVASEVVLGQGGVADQFDADIAQWVPEDIGVDVVREPGCRYRIIGGNSIGLFKAVDANNNLYIYRDFKLVIDIRLSKDCPVESQFNTSGLTSEPKSAQSAPNSHSTISSLPAQNKRIAWIIRAQDNLNYYLFELTLSRKGQWLKFYICEAGVHRYIGGKEIYIKYDDSSSFAIVTEARGGVFSVQIEVTSDPAATSISDQFRDVHDKFKQGRVGLSPTAGNELYLQTFAIEGISNVTAHSTN